MSATNESQIVLVNEDREQIGIMDFSGPHLTFEGNAEIGAMVLMNELGNLLEERLKQERNKIRAECIEICKSHFGYLTEQVAIEIQKRIEQ
jgi:hypothetical protein